MTTRTIRLAALIGIAALAPLMTAGMAAAGNPPPVHDGNPALWGPPLEQLCDDPALALAAGYNVLIDPLGAATNPAFTGGPAADAMYGEGGNDTISGASGDDVLCGSFGNDNLYGEQGNDALFGQGHNDDIYGGQGRDFLNGVAQVDRCNGGPRNDAGTNCDTVVSVEDVF